MHLEVRVEQRTGYEPKHWFILAPSTIPGDRYYASLTGSKEADLGPVEKLEEKLNSLRWKNRITGTLNVIALESTCVIAAAQAYSQLKANPENLIIECGIIALAGLAFFRGGSIVRTSYKRKGQEIEAIEKAVRKMQEDSSALIVEI